MFWTTAFIFWTADDAVAETQSEDRQRLPTPTRRPAYFRFLVFPTANAFVGRAPETAISRHDGG